MAKSRSAADLTIHVGRYRSFEWFWENDGSMPALDAYGALVMRDQDDFFASVEHWGGALPGSRPAQSRVNTENKDPLIVAIKAGKQRFTSFREESGATWIVYAHYLKEGEKRDKTGDRVVAATVKAREQYFKRVDDGTYYERD
jgi:hypothetical protein